MAKPSYVWNGSSWVAIASAFPSASQRFVKTISSNAHTLGLDDTGKELLINSSNPITLTIPNDTTYSFSIGQTFIVIPYGTGQITYLADGGVTLRSKSNNLKSNGQYFEAKLIKIDDNTWLLTGDLTS